MLMAKNAEQAIPAKFANCIYCFFPNSIVRVTYHDGGDAHKATASLQLLHDAAAQQLVLTTRYVTNQIACN